MADKKADQYAGYGNFLSVSTSRVGDEIVEEVDEYGSFEVLYADRDTVREWNEHNDDPDVRYLCGWYWWACFPGCLPDSDSPNGPYNTSRQAYRNAREED